LSASQKKNSFIPLLALILSGESIFFLPFVLPRIFRPTMLTALEITNTQLGYFFSAFGVVAMVAYLFGGVLADLFQSKKLISLALWLTAAGGLVMAAFLSPSLMPWLYGFWGLTSILLFWAAMLKATKKLGGENTQGKAFGWLEGGRGTIAAILGTIAYFLFSGSMNDNSITPDVEEAKMSLRLVVFVMSLIIALIGFFVWKKLPIEEGSPVNASKFELKAFIALLKTQRLWLISIVIICAYVGYKMTDEFSQYSNEILGLSQSDSAGIGTLALWLRAIVAFTSGVIGDQFGNLKMILFGFVLSTTGAVSMYFGLVGTSIGLSFLIIGMTASGLYTVRALYFAILGESKIDNKRLGMAIGIVSVLGYTPDIFVGPWMGYYLDTYPGIVGHQAVFGLMAFFAIIGLFTTILLKHPAKRQTADK
jgi:MFS family permease